MIPVNEPLIAPNALNYIKDCLDTGWVSSSGRYLELFESAFSRYIGVRHSTTTTNGTTALHLAFASLGIGEGDEVIVPSLTIVSCGLAALYVGATPVFVDVDPNRGTIEPKEIEKSITKKTKAILVVHLYGHPADMDPIMAIAKKHKLCVIEDAAEAHGAEYNGKKVGGIGDVGIFSFYGNKIVTTGEGGMLVTNSDSVYAKATLLKDLAHTPHKRFYHEYIGYNFRMTNIQAALGLAQLEQIDAYIAMKRRMAQVYTRSLRGIPSLELPTEAKWAKNVYWMYAVTVSKTSPLNRDSIRMKLKQKGIDTRDFFIPLHTQPVFLQRSIGVNAHCPVSEDLSRRGLYLPSGLAITDDQIQEVASTLKDILS